MGHILICASAIASALTIADIILKWWRGLSNRKD
jgi:hypothetical protein